MPHNTLGYPTITPYITIRGAAQAMDFYKLAFGAAERMRHADPDGKLRHGELQIGNSPLMLCDEFPEFSQMRSVQAYGGSGVNIFLSVEDADTMAAQAVAAGAVLEHPMKDAPYGRSGGVKDPFGITWWITAPKH
ncbi:MAG: VOC family protein [Bryobacterales bacterium]|nr:VOC family protein [Bryobacterales bacterium]